jgi:hypothetical protein
MELLFFLLENGNQITFAKSLTAVHSCSHYNTFMLLLRELQFSVINAICFSIYNNWQLAVKFKQMVLVKQQE